MKKDACILCGKAFPTGLHVMGCLICFPCEKALVQSILPPRRRKRLHRIYTGAEG